MTRGAKVLGRLVLALALGAGGCGGSGGGSLARDRNAAALPSATARAVQAMAPLALGLTALTVRGRLEVRRGGGDATWQPLAAGQAIAGVREIRVGDQGAIVALGRGEEAGRLWLRAGAQVRFGQDARGVHLSVEAGRARLRHRGGAVAALIVDDDLTYDVSGGDVVVDHDGGGAARGGVARGGVAVTATGARPALADWTLALEDAHAAAGVGRLEARADGAAENSKGEALALRRLLVDVRIQGDVAVTSVEHVFYNPTDATREGTFRFPVPDGAMLTGLAMEIGGKMMEGEIVERDRAREVYEKIVDQMLDPALLEWEEGNWFKLQVFPIEAAKEKRVVIRYVTPLGHGLTGWEYAWSLAAPDLGAPIGELVVTVDGTEVTRQRGLDHGLDVAVPIADAKVPAVMREVRADGVYTAVRVTPDWATLGGDAPVVTTPAGRRVVIVVDTSRSSLEGRTLALELLRTTLGELAEGDRFLVLASDIDARPHAEAPVPVSAAAIDAAVAFVAAIEPDGASDVGVALRAAGTQQADDVIYIGDGIATWGETDPAALGALADQVLAAPVHAALIGKGASSELWGELAGRTGGRAMVVRTPVDGQRFALAATHAGEVPRLMAARVFAADGADAGKIVRFPTAATTIYQGDDMLVVLRSPAGEAPPAALTLTGRVGDREVSQQVALGGAVETPLVGQRWASRQLAALEAADAPKDEVVALSRDFGVLSRYTSLLVLESEEAYAEHQIERKRAADALAAAAPQVTGGDLDSLGARQASLSPDEIQPGDPEIKIPAPRDARSVVVSFPFGDTKVAEFDDELDAWMVRFLIDKDTVDGDYLVRVTITHADGRVEVLELPYTVDTQAPAMKVTVTRDGAAYVIAARQQAAGGSRRKDADRVEVLLPDGTVMALGQLEWGKFEGRWVPALPLDGPATLRVVSRDHALNQATLDVVVGDAL